jgi:carboxypeptidase Taq
VKVVAACGYDFERGRLDLTAHPFTTKFSLDDVRITTRVNETDVLDAVFTMLHECGHALYEQGIRRELDGTPLASSASFSVDESQARLWENIVGRSRAFRCSRPFRGNSKTSISTRSTAPSIASSRRWCAALRTR